MMRRLGHGKAVKDAARGALQCRRGEAPKAALRLSPTFTADNGQRTKPHAPSAAISARAEPHATARRMFSTSPYPAPANRPERAVSYRVPASKTTTRRKIMQRRRTVRGSRYPWSGSPPSKRPAVRAQRAQPCFPQRPWGGLCGRNAAASGRAPGEKPRSRHSFAVNAFHSASPHGPRRAEGRLSQIRS